MQIGDEVAIIYKSPFHINDFGTITSETKKYWKVGNNLYNKETLVQRSTGLSVIEILTQEKKEQILKTRYAYFLERKKAKEWMQLNFSDLTKIMKIIREAG